MNALRAGLALLLAACSTAPPSISAPLASDAQIQAAETAPLNQSASEGGWAAPFAPFRVVGDVYYVGAVGVSAFLITTPRGYFLIDGGMPQSAPIILSNIATLGFDVRQVKYLLNSHAHYDHAGGLARLQQASGATFVASAGDRAPLEAGRISYGPSAGNLFPPIRVDRVIGDGETLTLGGVTLTAHVTAGHTPGCTSWSMETTGADGMRRRVFFHCSASVGGQSLVPEAYPGMIAAYRATFARVREMHADVFLASHGFFFDLEGRRRRQLAGDANAFVDADALQRYNTDMETAFNAELARQQAAQPPAR